MTHSRFWLTFLGIGLSGLLTLPSCSTDRSGLGPFDAGTGTDGVRNEAGSGTGDGAAATGGAGATGTAGRSGSGGVSATGGSGRGGNGGTGTGGAASGGRGTGGSATGGNNASGGSGTGGAGTAGSAGRGSGGTGTGGNGTGGRIGTGGVGTGGAGTGGRLGTGGIGTGGMGSGGRGTGGRGTGGSMAPAPECATASDCKLVSDCCTCAAVPVGHEAPQCALVCIQSKCAQQQLPLGTPAACVAGRCIAGFNCDDSRVSCDIATPNCDDGQVPAINAAGTCYAGGCVPASQCKTVSSCNVCGGTAPACVTYQTQMGNQHHCVTIPTACGGDATCGCLGPTSCVSPYLSCTNYSGNRGVSCGCPNC